MERAWFDASSREYKDNIRELSAAEAVKALEELNPVTFSYKAEPGEQHVGFIAEDVPALVATGDRKGLSAMDIVAVLTKVVKEQQEMIANLAERRK
ncbi:MAG: tail fiber domain-containing protein [Candidatus Moduliflexus flocculans]|nr:tail fiber domain-containing protein [Candidatus Moduliflexus flocculans]